MSSNSVNLLETWMTEALANGGSRSDAVWRMSQDLDARIQLGRFNEWADPRKSSRTPSIQVINYMMQTALPAVLAKEGVVLSDEAVERILGAVRLPAANCPPSPSSSREQDP